MKKLYGWWMLAGLAAVVGLEAGCARSRPARYFLLEPLAPAAAEATAPGRLVALAPVQLAGYLDRRPQVSRTKSGELRIHEFHRWAQPLAENVADVLTASLRAQGGLELVSFEHADARSGTALVQLRINRFEPDPSGQMTLDAAWEIRSGPKTTRGHRIYQVPAARAGGTAAYNEALARLARDLHAELVK